MGCLIRRSRIKSPEDRRISRIRHRPPGTPRYACALVATPLSQTQHIWSIFSESAPEGLTRILPLRSPGGSGADEASAPHWRGNPGQEFVSRCWGTV